VFDASTRHTIRIGSVQGPGRIGLGGNGSPGVIDMFDSNTNQTIRIDGQTGDIQVSGDIRLTNADCAEEFDVCEALTTRALPLERRATSALSWLDRTGPPAESTWRISVVIVAREIGTIGGEPSHVRLPELVNDDVGHREMAREALVSAPQRHRARNPA
jgi:hypothetical protein